MGRAAEIRDQITKLIDDAGIEAHIVIVVDGNDTVAGVHNCANTTQAMLAIQNYELHLFQSLRENN